MAAVLAITGPIYIIIAVGWLCARGGLFARADMRVFGKFVLQLALPALLFHTLSQRPAAEVLDARYLLAFAAGSLIAFGAAFAWARWGRRKGLSEAAMFGLGASCSNSGFIGYPIMLQAVGATAGLALALNMVVENVLILPLALVLAELGRTAADEGGWRAALRRSALGLVRNPLIIAIVLGLLFASLGWHLPAPAERAMAMVATSCGALALFVIGGSLGGPRVPGLWQDVPVIVFAKLLLHPMAVMAMVWLLPPANPALRTAAVVGAAVPMLGVFPVIAQKYGKENLSAAVQLVATLASFVTLTMLLWWLQP
ncbi:MAG: AEC family transporter [Burkholderiaceae bacterium]|nr:AEC family transporter [Burkholderiaceae bacterium]